MDTISLSAVFINRQPTNECTFEVSINGGPFRRIAPSQRYRSIFVNVPLTPRPLPLAIRATPTTNHHFPVPEGHFEYRGNGELVTISAPKEFMPPRGIHLAGHNSISVVVVLSRVRDRTNDVLTHLALVPGDRGQDRPTNWPPSAWNTPPLVDYRYIAPTPAVAGNLNFDLRTIDPDTEDRVFEVAGVVAPQLIAVSWPRALAPTVNSNPTPFLIYFRAAVGQNAPPRNRFYEDNGQGPYPLGWDYLFFGLWRYLNYTEDPLDDPFPKGLPYQIAASNKHAVLVLPLNRVRKPAEPESNGEVGVLRSAASAEELLREIQAFMFRQKGIYDPPELGHTALAAFSSGNLHVRTFLTSPENIGHPFYQNTLKEIYMFDISAHEENVQSWVRAATRWANTGASADKRIRAYTRVHSPSASGMLGAGATGDIFLSSRDGRRTEAALTISLWDRATSLLSNVRTILQSNGMSARDIENTVGSYVHQLISATMLTDALRRSGF